MVTRYIILIRVRCYPLGTRSSGTQAKRRSAQHHSAMVLLDQPPSPRAATAPDGLPDMEQRVAGLRREIAEEQAAALAVAVQALHPPERSQNMSREALRAVTVLPRCGHGILSAPSQPRRISSARAPMPKRVATSVWEWSGPKPPSNAERVAARLEKIIV